MSNVKEDSPTPPESSAGREELGLDVVFDQERLSKGPITNAYECHVCSACKQQFDSPDLVVLFEEEAFHTECFCCGECGSVVDATQEFLVLEGGSPLCSSCSPSCHACGEKVLSRHVGVLNKDFHEACLKCSQCQKVVTCSFSRLSLLAALLAFCCLSIGLVLSIDGVPSLCNLDCHGGVCVDNFLACSVVVLMCCKLPLLLHAAGVWSGGQGLLVWWG